MSWGEIKKAVNSNFQIPLNKKIEMIGGVWPRNCIFESKEFSKNYSGPNVNFGTDTDGNFCYEITGSGIVASISVTSNQSTWYNPGNGIWENAPANTSQAVLVIDNSKKITVTANINSSHSFSVDLNALQPTGIVSDGLDLTDKTINDALFFNNNFKLYIRFIGLTVQYEGAQTVRSASATIKYGVI